MSNNLVKNVLPAVAIMVAGLAGAYLVYDNYFNREQAAAVSTIEPAAGVEATTAVSTDAAVAAPVDAGAVDAVQGTADVPASATVSTETDSASVKSDGEVTYTSTTEEAAPAEGGAMAPAAAEATTETHTETKTEEHKETVH